MFVQYCSRFAVKYGLEGNGEHNISSDFENETRQRDKLKSQDKQQLIQFRLIKPNNSLI
jgi:hypothetical protein